MASALNGLKILLIRPAEQVAEWQEALLQQGAEVFPCATFAVEGITTTQQSHLRQQLKQLTSNDIVIFTSPNAVKYSQPLLPPQINQTPIMTIGPGTASKLKSNHILVNFTPSVHTSEGLLTSPLLQQVENKHIFIISGEGGREKLISELQQRGARVSKLAVYRRQSLKLDLEHEVLVWQQAGLNLILATTLEGLENLKNHIPSTAWPWFAQLPLMVLSSRLAVGAKKLGLKGEIIISSNSSITTILDELSTWYNAKNAS